MDCNQTSRQNDQQTSTQDLGKSWVKLGDFKARALVPPFTARFLLRRHLVVNAGTKARGLWVLKFHLWLAGSIHVSTSIKVRRTSPAMWFWFLDPDREDAIEIASPLAAWLAAGLLPACCQSSTEEDSSVRHSRVLRDQFHLWFADLLLWKKPNA